MTLDVVVEASFQGVTYASGIDNDGLLALRCTCDYCGIELASFAFPNPETDGEVIERAVEVWDDIGEDMEAHVVQHGGGFV